MPLVHAYLPDELYSLWLKEFKGNDQGSAWFQQKFKEYIEDKEDIETLKQKALNEKYLADQHTQTYEKYLGKIARHETQKEKVAIEAKKIELEEQQAKFDLPLAISQTTTFLSPYFDIAEPSMEPLAKEFAQLRHNEQPEDISLFLIKFAQFHGLKFKKAFPWLSKYNAPKELFPES